MTFQCCVKFEDSAAIGQQVLIKDSLNCLIASRIRKGPKTRTGSTVPKRSVSSFLLSNGISPSFGPPVSPSKSSYFDSLLFWQVGASPNGLVELLDYTQQPLLSSGPKHNTPCCTKYTRKSGVFNLVIALYPSPYLVHRQNNPSSREGSSVLGTMKSHKS